ncbi:MAG: NAD-dependent epimerase/dehydratase family protein [Chloroflexi bacterium]|nr:NAD-dependent epimerase/dehydratase family protein [Chloroflexota bacterium]
MNRLITDKRRDFWRDRPTFVTGVTGLLGSWLTRTLVDVGADVVALVRDWVPQSELVRSSTLERAKVVRGDVTDDRLMMRIFSDYEIDSCFHLAAQTIVGIANRMPAPTFETNIRGTWNVLEAARLWPNTARVVVASTDKAYGTHETLPYDEQAALQGQHPYDVSKSCADLISLSYAHSFDLNVAVTRCGNIYGGGDLNWNRLVPGSMRWTLRGEQPIIRSDGTYRRDYVYVLDIVDAYLTLAEAMVDGRHRGEAFNFGLNQPLSVLELVEQVIGLSPHPELEPIIEGSATNEIRHQYLDSSKAYEQLGWSPKFSMDEGLRETMAWYADYLERFEDGLTT